MDRWNNKVAIVTGASGGIGAAIAKNLVQSGLQVVGIGRRSEKIEEIANALGAYPGKLVARRVDMTKEDEIIDCFNWVSKNIGPVCILINNASIVENTRLIDGDTKIWKKIVDTNILGYSIASREAYRIMTANNIKGHIVNLNSIAGHKVIYTPGMSLYGPTKFAITSYTDLFRKELVHFGSEIKITSISPGLVSTDIFDAGSQEFQLAVESSPMLKPEHVADAISYVLSTPPEVQISELTIQVTGECY